MNLAGMFDGRDVMVMGVAVAASVVSMNRPSWAPAVNGASSALVAYHFRGWEPCLTESCREHRQRAQLADAVAFGAMGVGAGLVYAAKREAVRR